MDRCFLLSIPFPMDSWNYENNAGGCSYEGNLDF